LETTPATIHKLFFLHHWSIRSSFNHHLLKWIIFWSSFLMLRASKSPLILGWKRMKVRLFCHLQSFWTLWRIGHATKAVNK
jgi:hypothetical protein